MMDRNRYLFAIKLEQAKKHYFDIRTEMLKDTLSLNFTEKLMEVFVNRKWDVLKKWSEDIKFKCLRHAKRHQGKNEEMYEAFFRFYRVVRLFEIIKGIENDEGQGQV